MLGVSRISLSKPYESHGKIQRRPRYRADHSLPYLISVVPDNEFLPQWNIFRLRCSTHTQTQRISLRLERKSCSASEVSLAPFGKKILQEQRFWSGIHNPAGTWRLFNVAWTPIEHHDVDSTSCACRDAVSGHWLCQPLKRYYCMNDIWM